MGSRSRPHRVLSVCVCVCVSRCLWVCVIEANSLQLRVITIGLYQFLSRSPSCQILAVCGRRLRGVSGSWFPRFLSPAAFLDSDRRRLVCPLLPCATRLSPYGKLRFCLRKAPLLPTEAPRLPTDAPPLCLRKAPFSFSLCITSCNKLSFFRNWILPSSLWQDLTVAASQTVNKWFHNALSGNGLIMLCLIMLCLLFWLCCLNTHMQ